MSFLYAIGWTYLLWMFFLAVMALQWAKQRGVLSPTTLILAIPGILVAVLMDIALNIVATLPFLDRPHELTFSQRMGRYLREPSWRTPIAKVICGTFLDPFQIGGHCRSTPDE